jgi:hypothetical protein
MAAGHAAGNEAIYAIMSLEIINLVMSVRARSQPFTDLGCGLFSLGC